MVKAAADVKKATKQTTLAAFFGAPKPKPAAPSPATQATPKATPKVKTTPASKPKTPKAAPTPAAASTSPPSSSLRTPPSDPIEPEEVSANVQIARKPQPERSASLSPPPEIVSKPRSKPKAPPSPAAEAMDVDEEEEEVFVPGRRKRKAVKYVQSDNDVSEAGVTSEEPSSPSVASVVSEASPVKKPKKAAPKKAPLKASPSLSRPPLSHASSSGAADMFLTAAERKKIQAKGDKRNAETCFEFLVDIKDKEGNRPGDPEYDPRTIYIPKKSWGSFTPFERQFWEIKQNHYDTVLFFQKGKFYELYENDAAIGHQEFDLKLTDRVKMKMVGVPEQSFEFWAAKFLAAGYKVGKVEQAETAIGMEMRTTKGGGAKEIVRRELAQVFTNGTIVDGTYLTTDEANHCVSIKESSLGPNLPSSFGICVMDASTGSFSLTAFEDDICCTRLETMFRQIRPKELVFAKGNLSVVTMRLLRNILPPSTLWQSFKEGKEFLDVDDTIAALKEYFPEGELPAAITAMTENHLAVEAVGGLLYYLRTLNLDKDLISQKNFSVYDPIRDGKALVLDGQTLGHMEVLMNNEGSEEGTLLSLLQQCHSPFGKRLFRYWLTAPLRDAAAINARLDAVDDLMHAPSFMSQFKELCKGMPDLERLVSRIHAGSIRQLDFVNVMNHFRRIQSSVNRLLEIAEGFESSSVAGLLRSAPDLGPHLQHIQNMFTQVTDEKTIAILPTEGADEACDEADAAVAEIEEELNAAMEQTRQELKLKTGEIRFWHSAQGNKEIFHLEIPAKTKVPPKWTKCGSLKQVARYITPVTQPLIRLMQEARETQSIAKKNFFRHLLSEFDKDRDVWLKMVKVIAELDCLNSLARASFNLDAPKCRPTFVESDQAFIDFEDLRHPSMCLKRDFIANNVQLGGEVPRTTLLTGPNMAGKSTLLRMTAAAVIMAQMGCYVPAASARLSPLDKIQTRMGAYDNMFASASTFKVELDECSKILREAGPRSLVILDELGRGTSTYDGMAIAGAVLHHLSTHTLPLGFFATHYGSLTDDFAYHPNIRNMHMAVHVDDTAGVVFLYKLIKGHAESSHGTHVAKLAGVPDAVVARADEVSGEFFEQFQQKLESRRQSSLSIPAQADFAWLVHLAQGKEEATTATVAEQLDVVRKAVAAYV
ncbi:DNA mismatch repair-related protein [Trichosporon asahii var. asahii CBS 2479]|uniref:DNA mismatch repair protein n=1 Tax=Trichosporon asahii var. asahii (strain ATCC 90039 / CBS 2479 / JCM 2466 / KCTC 7840 / NBRC 103889/ NCYC 2677 / UAMH 7654) TaxID=1186058 RepID=J4U8E9_TRIAS|nr:DNA mismatch repair-related protein [Trichosporon asahii var. asahii CBS 2479]EJT46755.1 DNA mismatch repair-related protein [Trichosporon asahii var. asahii CBS 2479]